VVQCDSESPFEIAAADLEPGTAGALAAAGGAGVSADAPPMATAAAALIKASA
jgi:hypothetical protein